MSLTHLSLFSGIGGLDFAAEMAGFKTVGQCEWADYPTKVLEKHWPGLPRWRDIRTLTGEDFYAKTGLRTVDIISGGFPCQPFSLAGQRRGQADDRYLWPEMLRVVSELRPTWVIGENVAGLVSMVQPSAAARVESRIINRQPDEDFYEAVLSRQEDYLLLQLIGDLERIGYEVQPLIIPACAVGAAHRRDRLAIIAHSNRDTGRSWWAETERQQRTARTSSGGNDVAHSNSTERGPQRSARNRLAQRKNGISQWEKGEGRFECCGETVADTQEPGSRGLPVQPRGSQQADANAKWGGEDVSHAESIRQQGERATREQIAGARRQEEESEGLCADGDPAGAGLPYGANQPMGRRESQPQPERPDRRTAQPGLGGVVDGIPAWMDGYWLEEPDIPRVASGVKGRVDKLKALGNAVYWRQFYPIFAGIHHIEGMKKTMEAKQHERNKN